MLSLIQIGSVFEMVVLHVIIAVVFGVAGAVFGLSLGVPTWHIGALYGLCGAMGLLLSMSAVMLTTDLAGWRDKQAQSG